MGANKQARERGGRRERGEAAGGLNSKLRRWERERARKGGRKQRKTGGERTRESCGRRQPEGESHVRGNSRPLAVWSFGEQLLRLPRG